MVFAIKWWQLGYSQEKHEIKILGISGRNYILPNSWEGLWLGSRS
jgi:hypothetical protein